MTANHFRLAGFALVAFAIGWSPAGAQDNPPVVQSESIASGPFRPGSAGVGVTERETKSTDEHVATPAKIGARPADSWFAVATLHDPAPPHLGVPANCSSLKACPPAATELQSVAKARPAPLTPSDSEMFAASAGQPAANDHAGNGAAISRRALANTPRIPKMTKMFSFDTTDKVIASRVAPAFDQFQPELTLNLDGPESVGVNQVFQQLVQVRNSSGLPLHELRVTQVCDLTVLGADHHQAVTIDCLEPGETKTVRFSARALQPGTFAVRYVAENSRIQADIDNRVQVSDASLSVDVVRPTAR